MIRIYKLFFLGFFILMLSHFVYWKTYWKPEIFFWDENYHIASAAKYLKGVFFMEPHPPLGKMILALGEKLVNVNNGQTYGYENFDLIPHEALNEAFSFAGYRFFSALFAVFDVLIFSAIIYMITSSYVFTAAFCAFPLLDTALLLHLRGAMLDSFLIFGHLICILGYLALLRTRANENNKLAFYGFLMTFGFAFAVMTKLFGLALIVLWPLLYFLRPDLRKKLRIHYPFHFVFVAIFSLSIWATHIGLGKQIRPSLVHQGMYMGSSDYERWLLGLEKDSWTHFPQKLYEHLRYIMHYELNVGEVDWDDRNTTGSYALGWPFGSRPIPYRWQKTWDVHRYLYLIPNPWAWGFGLLGLVLTTGLVIRRGRKIFVENPAIFSMLFLYAAYFFPMWMIRRVLYLYHYFPMLFISWILLALVLFHLSKRLGALWNKRLALALCLIPLLLFQGYYMYRDFVFFAPLDCHTLGQKYIPPFWGVKFQSCINEANNRRFLQLFKNNEP